MSLSRGLSISVGGAIVIAFCMVALIFLPDALPGIGMAIGGVAVIGGFIWTLAGYYLSSDQPPEA